jgi:hypothetical protein
MLACFGYAPLRTVGASRTVWSGSSVPFGAGPNAILFPLSLILLFLPCVRLLCHDLVSHDVP